jgi:hypothetical protein
MEDLPRAIGVEHAIPTPTGEKHPRSSVVRSETSAGERRRRAPLPEAASNSRAKFGPEVGVRFIGG